MPSRYEWEKLDLPPLLTITPGEGSLGVKPMDTGLCFVLGAGGILGYWTASLP